MPRLAAQQTAGYFPTPAHLIPALAALVDPGPACQPRTVSLGYPQYGTVALLDPCAGTGAALIALAHAWCGPDLTTGRPHVRAYGCELETQRASALQVAWGRISYQAGTAALAGDAFRATWDSQSAGVSVLYLNPPYDQDPRYGRLEEAFLARFTPALRPDGGILLLVIPAGALAASAATLATHYAHLACYRFPPAEAQYHQVVLVARRARHPLPAEFAAEATPPRPPGPGLGRRSRVDPRPPPRREYPAGV